MIRILAWYGATSASRSSPRLRNGASLSSLLIVCGACASPQGVPADLGPHPLIVQPYLADPRVSYNGIAKLSVLDRDIDEVGSSLWRLHAGGRFGLIRWDSETAPMQLDGEAGFVGEFDLTAQNLGIGWDGTYALIFSGLRPGGWEWRAGSHHVSSHLGDEYIEETGRERLNITREEFLAGLGYRPDDEWRLYGETGWAYSLGNHGLLDRWRLQGGLERRWDGPWPSERYDTYLALDVSAYEENDWEPNASLGIGLLHLGSHGLPPAKLGFEFYAGRVRMGEFFDERETVLAFGLWL